MNVILLVVSVWGGKNRKELELSINVFLLRVWGVEYREEWILNVTVLYVSLWICSIERD